MSSLNRIQDLLPLPYSLAPDSVLSQVLNVVALELDALQEDIERVRQSHWMRTAARLIDVEKIAALVGVKRLSWESRDLFRERVLALVEAQVQGAIGPREIREFVYDYILTAERAAGCTFVPGLSSLSLAEAYEPPPGRETFRPLRLVENPLRRRRSATLQARSGKVPYLFRWQENNRGLDDSIARLTVTGVTSNVTTVPILANLTTGDLVGYSGLVRFGETLVLSPSGESREASATLNGEEVTAELFSVGGFQLGVPFERDQFDVPPRLPRLIRGSNEWIYLSVGLYDLRGLNRFHFAVADDDLREGTFNETNFDRALFPAGPQAQITMEWDETEPASFVVEVPRHITVEPADASVEGRSIHEDVAEGLRTSIGKLHAAGVKTEVNMTPFSEEQPQMVVFQLSAKILDPEAGPAGENDQLSLGGRFGESTLGGSRFE